MASLARAILVLGLAAGLSGCSRAAVRDADRAARAEASSAVATSGVGQAASAQSNGTAGQTTSSTPPPAVDPHAVETLDKMGAYLRTLTAFQVVADTTRDEVQDDGEQYQFDGHVDMLVQRPNRLRAEVTSDRQQRLYFFDGKSFTLWARRVNYYATVPAPATLGELSDRLQDKYGIEVPLGDLFMWGTPGHHNTADIQAASDVGPSEIGNVTCEHFAFRQADVDWQVWVQLGSYPLPRKLVITTKTDPARPQYSSTLTWNLAPSFNDAAFVFDPPADAQKIALQEQPGK